MFGRKRERDSVGKLGPEATSRDFAIDGIPPRPPSLMRSELPATYPRPSSLRPEPPPSLPRPTADAARRLPDIPAPTVRRNEPRPVVDGDSKRLIVGREIVLTGEIKACERLVVEGRVDAALSDIRTVEITETGMLKGKAQVESADVAGSFEGDLVVQKLLLIRPTGRVSGNVRYGAIEIERGGRIGGQFESLNGSSAPEPAAAAGADAEPSVATVRFGSSEPETP